MQGYYDLLQEVSFLSQKERENWDSYIKFVEKVKKEKDDFKQKVLDNINELSFFKREIEKKIAKELEVLKNVEKVDVFLVSDRM